MLTEYALGQYFSWILPSGFSPGPRQERQEFGYLRRNIPTKIQTHLLSHGITYLQIESQGLFLLQSRRTGGLLCFS